MPLWTGAYRRKTGHLGMAEHGAYLLLIMHYWENGGLPDDDRQLARIVCAEMKEWKKVKPIIEKLFEPGWKHKKVEEELAKAAEISSKRRASAEQMHMQKSSKRDANAQQEHTHTQPPSQSQVSKDSLNAVVRAVKKPPFHGAQDEKHVYWNKGTPEWEAYADEHFQLNGKPPNVNKHGGKWFPKLGYQAEILRRGVHPDYKAKDSSP